MYISDLYEDELEISIKVIIKYKPCQRPYQLENIEF